MNTQEEKAVAVRDIRFNGDTLNVIEKEGEFFIATRRCTPGAQAGNRSTYSNSFWIERGMRQLSSRIGTTKMSSSGTRRAHSRA